MRAADRFTIRQERHRVAAAKLPAEPFLEWRRLLWRRGSVPGGDGLTSCIWSQSRALRIRVLRRGERPSGGLVWPSRSLGDESSGRCPRNARRFAGAVRAETDGTAVIRCRAPDCGALDNHHQRPVIRHRGRRSCSGLLTCFGISLSAVVRYLTTEPHPTAGPSRDGRECRARH